MTEGSPPIDSKALAKALRIYITVDHHIFQAINRYGAEAVKAAVARHTKPRRGRKLDNDAPELAQYIEADSKDWLAGRDPFAMRTNYAIAKAIAGNQPGHDVY